MLDKEGNLEPLLTIRQVCQILNVHANTLRNWDRQHRLIPIRIGLRGDRRYRQQDILRIFDIGRVNEGKLGVIKVHEGQRRDDKGKEGAIREEKGRQGKIREDRGRIRGEKK